MGDTSIDFFLDTLEQLITSSKLNSIINEKPQLQSLEVDIKYLRGFLKVTEKKRDEHSEVMKLVMDIRDVVSDAENVVERFVINAFKPDNLSEDENIRFTIDGFKADDLSLNLESVKKEIKILTAEVKKIYDENIYDINGVAVKKYKHSSTRSGVEVSSSAGGSYTSKVVEEKLVVGFDEEVEKLIEILDDKGEGRPLEIITIIGPGGRGKTTLARKVYDHPFTSHIFEIRAWVDVSQDYDKTTKKDLLICVLKSAFPENYEDYKKRRPQNYEDYEKGSEEDYEKSSEDILGEEVLRCLKGRKYLIVMDDIWGIEAWNDSQRSYPNELKGSKVLFTSRQLIQPDCVRFVPWYLKPLPKSRSWELLHKKVFGKECCPTELVEIGVKIAEKCKGLPLAIITIAGILATQDKTLDVWKEVAKHLSSIIAKNEADCMKIFELSYNHLPLHLKACFLYIGAFLEDSEIRVRELLWLWIAEGFIQPSEGGKRLEDVAKAHLIDLIDRSLVMVARKSSLGGIKTCRIHDLLRVFCLKKAEEENFLVQFHEGDSFSPPAANRFRRLVIGDQFFDKFSLGPRARNLHSFLCLCWRNYRFVRPVHKYQSYMSFFAKNFERLKVLGNFILVEWKVRIRRGHLVHLRYLAIVIAENFMIGMESISNLLNLETLDLEVEERGVSIQLPSNIFKMVKLRHLYSKRGVFKYHFSFEEAASVGFGQSSKLDSLQTLHKLCACKDCRNFLLRTPNLRKLGLTKTFPYPPEPPSLDLEFLKCLEILSFSMLTLTAGMKLPPTIKRLTLGSMLLEWEELSVLQNLPSLEVLKFTGITFEGPVWNTSEEGFPQLKYLCLHSMDDIEEWNASEDQFPRLEVLVLKDCIRLEQIPLDFANLNELRKIQVIECAPSVEESARRIQEGQRNRRGDDDCPHLIVKHSILDLKDADESE